MSNDLFLLRWWGWCQIREKYNAFHVSNDVSNDS